MTNSPSALSYHFHNSSLDAWPRLRWTKQALHSPILHNEARNMHNSPVIRSEKKQPWILIPEWIVIDRKSIGKIEGGPLPRRQVRDLPLSSHVSGVSLTKSHVVYSAEYPISTIKIAIKRFYTTTTPWKSVPPKRRKEGKWKISYPFLTGEIKNMATFSTDTLLNWWSRGRVRHGDSFHFYKPFSVLSIIQQLRALWDSLTLGPCWKRFVCKSTYRHITENNSLVECLLMTQNSLPCRSLRVGFRPFFPRKPLFCIGVIGSIKPSANHICSSLQLKDLLLFFKIHFPLMFCA